MYAHSLQESETAINRANLKSPLVIANQPLEAKLTLIRDTILPQRNSTNDDNFGDKDWCSNR